MIKKSIKVIGILILASLVFLAATSLWALKGYKKYIEDNPPITITNPEKCSASGLVAHWKFDEINNNITPDSTEHHKNGTLKYWLSDLTKILYGAPKIVKGVDKNGLEFNGRQWVSAGNDSCFSTETFTISAWIWQDNDYVQGPGKITHRPWPYNVPTIMAKGSWPYDGWWLCSTTTDADGKMHYRDIDIGIAWGDGFTHVKSGYQLPLREWHHVVVSMDNKRHEAQFYIDGKIFGAKQTGIPNWLVNWNHDLFLGEYDGSGRWPWEGRLDDVRFYNKVLSNEEALAIYSPHVTSEILQ